MKQILITLVLFCSLALGCEKSDNKDCNGAVIDESSCGFWTITRGAVTYEADKLPDEFKVKGLQVCAEFEVTTNPIACICCLDKAKIISISKN